MLVTDFQHVAVEDDAGPHVTLMAGVDLGGRYWSTTAETAAKVRAARRGSPGAVLRAEPDGWSLRAGRVTVLDVRRPLDGLSDPVTFGLAPAALARIGLVHGDQIAGYAHDVGAVPAGWRVAARVMLVVGSEHRIHWSDDGVGEATGHFVRRRRPLAATRQRRRRVAPALLADLPGDIGVLLARPTGCAVGLTTVIGPVVVPGRWEPAGSVVVRADVMEHLDALLPGRCSVTVDDSAAPEPSGRCGVMLRGDAAVLRGAPADDELRIAVHVDRTTSWLGFSAETRHVG